MIGPMTTCPTCGGDGEILKSFPQRDDPEYCRVDQCPECGGCGWVSSGDIPEPTDEDWARYHGDVRGKSATLGGVSDKMRRAGSTRNDSHVKREIRRLVQSKLIEWVPGQGYAASEAGRALRTNRETAE